MYISYTYLDRKLDKWHGTELKYALLMYNLIVLKKVLQQTKVINYENITSAVTGFVIVSRAHSWPFDCKLELFEQKRN